MKGLAGGRAPREERPQVVALGACRNVDTHFKERKGFNGHPHTLERASCRNPRKMPIVGPIDDY